MIEDVMKETKHKMEVSIDALEKEFVALRTGRAHPSILDHVEVDAYGSRMPIPQLATVTVPQPRTLYIQPFDKNTFSAIEKAIQKSDLNLTPNSDGKNIILEFPAPTEERRKDLAKQAKKMAEETKVAVRNVRRDGKDKIEKMEKGKEISEDDKKRALDRLQKLTDEFIEKIEKACEKKEKEIMEF